MTFEPGEAFWLQNDGEEGVNTFNTSGAVNQKDIAFLLATDSDAVLCGNCTPVSIALQDMLCPEAAKNKIFLSLLNGDGSAKATYTWARTKQADGSWKYGWKDDSNDFAKGVTFKPGQGFWVQNDGTEQDGFTLTLPGVEL